MSKYRILKPEELNTFEKEFIEYLVVNGITAADWEEIKKSDQKKAASVIEYFSDVVFEGIMRKVDFLDFKSEKSLKSFQCFADKIILVAMDLPENTPYNFLNLKDFNTLKNNITPSTKIYTQEKKYSKTRELELFDMITNGCEIAEGQLFKAISMAL